MFEEPKIKAYYYNKKFREGEIRNAILSVAETFKPEKSESIRLTLRYSSGECREVSIKEDPSLNVLCGITKLDGTLYGFVLELGNAKMFFGYVDKILQLHIYHSLSNEAFIMQGLFEVVADLYPKINTCYCCNRPNPDANVTLTMKKTLNKQMSYTYNYREILKKEIKVPRCRRCASMTSLFEILSAILLGLGIILSTYFMDNTLHLIIFIILYIGLGILALLLLMRALHFKYKPLRGYPACKAAQADRWEF